MLKNVCNDVSHFLKGSQSVCTEVKQVDTKKTTSNRLQFTVLIIIVAGKHN